MVDMSGPRAPARPLPVVLVLLATGAAVVGLLTSNLAPYRQVALSRRPRSQVAGRVVR